MCGRYYIDEGVIKHITENFKYEEDVAHFPSKDIHPGDKAPVIMSVDGELKACIQRWGIVGNCSNGIIFNARSENVLNKAIFKKAIKNRRAVVPAKCFFEWSLYKEKSAFFSTSENLLYLAGFYDLFDNEAHFEILTTKANSSVEKVHDRMPVIISEEEIYAWINNQKLLRSFLYRQQVDLEKQSEVHQMEFDFSARIPRFK
ncbi:Putative SOS response-associated peptidase YedK [Acetitomaculum ruminis DSM 5522]|uniref:Abasic site processing protein n=1 Tax=Acetitomaculum ruminis DSM 5522 TaxID=1120918 RepID=A0A1I0YZ50_9FIRM|nr:SOS response-associated peptidase family protein [Acetitomaculum ruminis]SFB18561.1 Putative SOS response-associated peptidase YedK [Acetitomaculum ruminis DSM 5522]